MSIYCNKFLKEISQGTIRDKKIFTFEALKTDPILLKNAFFITEDNKKQFKIINGNDFVKLERRMNPKPMAPANIKLNMETAQNYNLSKWISNDVYERPVLFEAIQKNDLKLLKYLIYTGEMNLNRNIEFMVKDDILWSNMPSSHSLYRCT